MIDNLLQAIGGLGLFLFGMSVMTEGLQGLAGNLLHHLLARFTRSPLSGAISGAVATAILQSSSATTVAAVGFVAAGLLTFSQALGIIFGANLGTTVTGWLVALLGLKLNIGDLTLPLVLLGALMRLFGYARVASAGTAIAGFGLVFLGITVLQQGMAVFHDVVTPDSFPADNLGGRMLLVMLGIAITLVTQSSSAGVAAALTGVYTGTLGFSQAAAMVIGMDVGTTVTAALATIGGSRETRRTGYSHVIYNLMTGLVAFFILPLYTAVLADLWPTALRQHAEIALVGFHSLFNLLGVVLVLPFTGAFARLMYWLVPAKGELPESRLDKRLLSEPTVALSSAIHLVIQQVQDALRLVYRLLREPGAVDADDISFLKRRLSLVRTYLDGIHLSPEQERDWKRLNAAIHLLDHLGRLLARCEEEPDRIHTLVEVEALAQMARNLSELAMQLDRLITDGRWPEVVELADRFSGSVDEQAEMLRSRISRMIAQGELDMEAGGERLEAVRWVRRVAVHIARIVRHARLAQ